MGAWERWICARVAGEALDVGGDGEIAILLGREGHRVVEVESRHAGAPPFEDGSFDTVIFGDWLAQQVSRERPIAEARRVLRPGGRLIVTVPYAGSDEGDGSGLSLGTLLGELAEFALSDVATVDDRLCLVAVRAREKSRATVWRRALDVAERRLAERDAAVGELSSSVTDLEARSEREERALADARGDVERLEAALAAAAHQRDLKEEAARLATDGVAQLEQRLERLRQSGERELAEAERKAERALAAAERQLAKAQTQLEARDEELERSRLAAQEAQGELTAARDKLGERERELVALERDRVRQLGVVNERLAAREQELQTAKERLAAREQELDASNERLAATGRDLEAAGERIANHERELDAVGALIEAKDGELAETHRQLAAEEGELGKARARLEERERHLQNAHAGIESRDRRLAAADRSLESGEAELRRLRTAAQQQERKLATAEARLEKSQLRAERFRSSLVSIREGRSYRLMRVLWRLRRPFKRASRRDPVEASAGADDESGPPATAAETAPTPVAPDKSRTPASVPEIALPAAPPRRQPGGRLRVAAILDEMSAACFAPECELIPLSLDGWHEQLDDRQPDLLLVESAWNANDGEWQYRIAEYPRKDLVGLPALRALLDGCRERGIPTAFWNKEDPVHFDRFAEAASLFDHVFTTDAGCVERYRALPGAPTVTPLPFAAQPRIHNPMAVVDDRSAAPCFAGAWYRDRHPDRRRSLEALLDAARPYGLVIYDRRFGTEEGAYGFPERFEPYILGRLPYDRVLDVYKSHHLFLNANSVVASPTMCSRRVFELAACDTPILSTPGAALSELFGDGLIAEARDEPTAKESLERLLGDPDERTRRARAARRVVFARHTYGQRLKTIAATAGLDTSSLEQQSFALPGDSTNGAGDLHPWLLVMQPGVALSKQALADLAAAASFADAEVIGAYPARNGDPAVEHRQVPDVDPRAMLMRRELVEARGRPSGTSEDVLACLREWSDDGVRIYAADADLLLGKSKVQ